MGRHAPSVIAFALLLSAVWLLLSANERLESVEGRLGYALSQCLMLRYEQDPNHQAYVPKGFGAD